MSKVSEFIKEFNDRRAFTGTLRFDEPLSSHTTFKTGGPADVWIRPEGESFPDYAGALLAGAKNEGIPVFILGGGANILASDEGFRGIALDTGSWTGGEITERTDELYFRAGTDVDQAVEYAASRALSGFEFLAGMPGSIGGALWMNARCYGVSLSDRLVSVEILDTNGTDGPRRTIPCCPEEFGYKKSPFQSMNALILGGRFAFTRRPEEEIRREMEEYVRNRKAKGHYRYPSAGSVFKNNHVFGKPTGQIIDELGLQGLRVGGAQVAPWHGNIIINRENAAAADIHKLIKIVKDKVYAATSLELECEVLFLGFHEEA